MRTERNDFQQLVDSQLRDLQWDSAGSAAVFRKLRQQKKAPARRLPRYALTCAMAAAALCLIITAAVQRAPVKDTFIAAPPSATAALPIQKPDTRAEAVFQARQAVMEQYGLTLATLGIFLDDCTLTADGWTVTFETTGQINRRLAGIYTVQKACGVCTASWSHDDVDPAVWVGGGLNRTAWGQPQLLYARDEGAREAMTINMELNALEGTSIDYSYIEGRSLWGDVLAETKPAPGDISPEKAAESAIHALVEQFGLPWETLSVLEDAPVVGAAYAHLLESESGVRVWVFTPSMKLEGTNFHMAVCINAQTGVLERLEYTTLGNG